jgi:hypothetical protein
MTTQSFRERCIEKMFTAYVCDEDGGPYSGVAAAFDAVFPEILEECVKAIESAECILEDGEEYSQGYNDAVLDAIYGIRSLNNDIHD